MTTRTQRDKEKKQQEKYQAILRNLLLEQENKYCVDCDAKGPRWASWNLGIFLCIRCAGIHRNLGVHISKVKSVNLDTWTEEQITSVEGMGNFQGRKIYESTLPTNYKRPQTDSSLEQFIRAKYEHKKYMDKTYVPKKQPNKRVEQEKTDKEKKREKVIASGKIASLQKPPQSVASKSPSKVQQPPPVTAKKFEAPSIAEPAQTTLSPNQRTLTPVKSASALNDLLSLDTPKSFSSPDLLSLANSSEPSAAPAAPALNGDNIEQDLFGVEKTDKAGGKTSKESILALYGSQASQPAYGVPGGMYIPAQQTSQMGANFAAPPGGNIPQQNGPISFTAQPMMAGPMGMPNAGMGAPNVGMGQGAPNVGMGQGAPMGPPNAGIGMMGMHAGYGANQMQAQQAYLQQVQQQMKNIRVSPMMNGQMGQMQQQPQQQPQGWNAGFNTGMQQSGFQAQGNMGWNGNMAGHTHSTQLWN